MNPVDRITRQGQPFFYIRNLPPESIIDLEIERPEVYYGELTDDVVYVDSGLEEFDYPTTNQNVYSSYEGEGGVPLSSWLRRLGFAIRFGETNLLLSEYIDEETRVMMHRQIQERVQRVAPFLLQDDDPYIVAADGRLYWVIDAYTISNDFPYSQPLAPSAAGLEHITGRINYIRNSVKIVVDAYQGSVDLYLVDADDPIIQSYARAFPGLFQPFDAMPTSLQQHIRYPEDMFEIQTIQYLTYHMEDVQVFYNKEDLWSLPQEVFAGNRQLMEPYYVTFPLPGNEEPEFMLIQPFTPDGRDNMIAWIAARSDPEHYGELEVFEMPKQENVFGPLQVEGRIDQEPLISEQFSLWDQLGSNVIRGNLIVVPVNDSFLYVEPVYLESETTAIPELKRVIVADGENVVMRETLDEALAALLAEAPPVAEIVVDPPVEEEPPLVDEEEADDVDVAPPDEEEVDTAPDAADLDATVEELILSANRNLEAALAAQRAGDWAAYGEAQDALQRDLEQLMALTNGNLP